MRSCSFTIWRRVASSALGDSSSATCLSICSNSCCASSPASNNCAGDEAAVRYDIIAFRFHHDHEITLTFHVKQHPGFALAFHEKRMQIVDCGFAGGFKRHPDADCSREWDFG